MFAALSLLGLFASSFALRLFAKSEVERDAKLSAMATKHRVLL